MGTLSAFLMAELFLDLAQKYPLQSLIFWVGIIWIIASVITITVMVDKAKKQPNTSMWRHKGVRLFALLSPLLFWLGYGVYCFFAHFVFDETAE